MRLAVDGAMATPLAGGVGNYAMRIIRELAACHDFDVLVLVPDFAVGRVELPQPTGRFRVEVVAVGALSGERSYQRRARWEQQILPHHLDGGDREVFFGPVFMAPCDWPGPKVVTVHDLAFARSAYYNTPESTAYYDCWARRCAEQATALLAVSHHTRADIAELWGIANGVYVTHLAPCVAAPGCDACESARLVADILSLTPPFALFVGDEFPRKNIRRLMAAVAREDCFGPRFPLVVTRPSSAELTALAQQEQADDRIRAIGHCSSDLLPHLYRTASFLAYPSLFEGFGLPPLEAMACGTPVAATTAGSVPEVLQDNAVYFEPRDIDSIATAIGCLARNPSLRANLVERGRAHVTRFSWERTAEQTVSAIKQSVAG